jgi:nitrite reductase/ring-hydroxylating ferredoxin subunit
VTFDGMPLELIELRIDLVQKREQERTFCPLHSSKFDLATGRSLTEANCSIEAYPARLGKRGQILVNRSAKKVTEAEE